jgi:hypothetical protein
MIGNKGFLIVVVEILTLVILALTLGALLWYTIVTRRIQRAMVAQVDELVRQRQLTTMPAFVATIRRRDGDYLELTNIGKGIAVNVTVDDVIIRYPTLASGHIEFVPVIRIPAGELALMESMHFVITGSEEGDKNSLTFLGSQAHYDADVTIRFQDIEGTKYAQTVRMGKSGYEHGFVRVESPNSFRVKQSHLHLEAP